jgi:hypothetical protein
MASKERRVGSTVKREAFLFVHLTRCAILLRDAFDRSTLGERRSQ